MGDHDAGVVVAPGHADSVGMLDPALLAGGRRWHTVRPGMMLGLTNMVFEQPLVYDSRTFPVLCLSVVLEGYATNNIQGMEGGFCRNEVWITSTGDSVATSMTILPDQPVRVVELLLTPEWEASNQAAMGHDPVFLSMADAMRQPLRVRRLPLDAQLRQLAWAAFSPTAPDVFACYHLEACALAMFGILAKHFQPDLRQPDIGQLTARGLERVTAVRRCIDADPGAVSSIAQLAARFSASQSVLKRDFQQAFGTSVRDYLFERRMLVGRNAILRDRLSIAEAAYRAGYEHPANFTTAFRKHFGYPPSMLKS